MEHRKFAKLSCNQCGYTELYKMKSTGTLSNLFDPLTT